MAGVHQYNAGLVWTGNKGLGTANYKAYGREHTIFLEGKPAIQGSSDTHFRGDGSKYNPEDMLVAALMACHLLTYLHVCAVEGVIVVGYTDKASGIMEETANGGGRFTEVTLHPVVLVSDASMVEKANKLHTVAHEKCFIANSVNFPVLHLPTARAESK